MVAVFPPLGGGKNVCADIHEKRRELVWCDPTTSHHDPPTALKEIEVRRILDLQKVANNMPDSFTDLVKVTRSHIAAANVPARIDIPEGQPTLRPVIPANESCTPALKRGRPVGSKDSHPRKRVSAQKVNPSNNNEAVILPDPSHEIIPDYGSVLETKSGDASIPSSISENREILVSHACINEVWHRDKVIINDVFAYNVANEIISGDDIEPRSIEECKQRVDWP